jgi:hypothetical protein
MSYRNHIIIYEDYAEIVVYRFMEEVARTIIDINKIELLDKYKWHIDKEGYIHTNMGSKRVVLSRFLLGLTDPNIECNHIDGNTLNNRINNLRPATSQQNKMNRKRRKNNTSGQTGVYWEHDVKKWRACIYLNKKKINLGYFINLDEAIKIRKEAEIKYFGEYRCQRPEQLQLPFEFS